MTTQQLTSTRTLFAFATAMNVQPHIAIWVVYLTDFRGITLTQVALMEGMFWAVTMLLELPTGALSDRFGRRTAFLLSTAVGGAAAIAFGFAGSFEALAFSYVLWGTAVALQSGSLEAYLYDQLDADGLPEEYPRMAGRMSAFMTVSFMLGGIGGGLTAAAVNLQAAVLIAAVPYVFAFLLATRLKEPAISSAESKPSYFGTLAGAMRTLRDVPTVRWMILFQTALALTMVADFMFLQPFLGEYGTPVALFGILAVPVTLSRIGGSIAAHRLLTILGLRKMLSMALALAVAGVLILALIDHVAAFAGLALAALMTSTVAPVAGGYINQRVTSEVRATVMSVMPLGMALLFALAIPLLGLAADVDLSLAFISIAGFVGAAAGVSLLLWHFADLRDPRGNTGTADPVEDAVAAAGGGR